MKHRTAATALNFVIPGAGLWYLGLTKAGILNLLVAVLVPTVIGMFWPGEHVLYILLAVAAGSAGFAHAAASRTASAADNSDGSSDGSMSGNTAT